MSKHSAEIEKANRLLDKKPAEAIAIIEKVLAKDPQNVEAAYLLAWELDRRLSATYDDALKARISCLVEIIVSGTSNLANASTMESRARGFALAWGLPGRCVTASVAEATALRKTAAEAHRPRESDLSDAAMRAAEMGLAWARARAEKKPESGYEALLAWVRKTPVHGSWVNPHNADDLASCAGLEPFFEDDGYLAWVRDRAAKPPVLRGAAAKKLARGLCCAAGHDAEAHKLGVVEPPRFGRRGRVLSLLALGAPLDAEAEDTFGQSCSPIYYAALASGVELVRFLVALGFPINGRDKRVPLVQLVLHAMPRALDALLEAGANPSARGDTGYGPNLTAAELAVKRKLPKIAQRLGVKKQTTGLDTKPIRALFSKQKKTLLAGPAFKGRRNFPNLTAFFDAIDLQGRASWAAATSELDMLDPEELLALAQLLAALHPKVSGTTRLGAADAQHARIVVGDAELDGDALLGTGTAWVITGSLRTKKRFALDEAARVAIAGTLHAKMVEAEGELWIGGDLAGADVVWAENESGALLVGGTLTARVLLCKDHEVRAGKLSAKTTLNDTTQKRGAAVFPAAAFEKGSLSAARVWRLVAKS